jgi:UDP-N-acetylglucosamine acyltransferase
MTDNTRHPTAVIASGAELADDVVVGPHAVIEDHVSIGAGTVIGPHVVIHSYARVGARNRIHAHAVIADIPQDYSFSVDETWVEIGDDNVLREGFTVHRSTSTEQPTRIGSSCFLMTYTHVAHDCQVGDGVVMTTYAGLAGCVQVGDGANIGGGAAIHQFCRIGSGAIVGGQTGILKDVLPYSMVFGLPALHYRLNTVGLKRAGVTGERYRALEKVFRALRVGAKPDFDASTPELQLLKDWLAADSKRGLTGFFGAKRSR